MGEDMNCPPVASPSAAGQAEPLSDALWASFDVLQETLVHLDPATRREQGRTLSKFMSHSWDLLPGELLHAGMPISILRQHVQKPCRLDAELNFVVDFHLPSPEASSQPIRLPDGRWELDTSIQMVMVKSLAQMVTQLQEWATYASFKAWLSVVKDWVSSHTHTTPENLGLVTVCAVAHLTISLGMYSWLETCGVLGIM